MISAKLIARVSLHADDTHARPWPMWLCDSSVFFKWHRQFVKTILRITFPKGLRFDATRVLSYQWRPPSHNSNAHMVRLAELSLALLAVIWHRCLQSVSFKALSQVGRTIEQYHEFAYDLHVNLKQMQ